MTGDARLKERRALVRALRAMGDSSESSGLRTLLPLFRAWCSRMTFHLSLSLSDDARGGHLIGAPRDIHFLSSLNDRVFSQLSASAEVA